MTRFGDVQQLGMGDQGLYHEDTRYLSHLELLIDGVRPMFLGSAVKEDNSVLNLCTTFFNPRIGSRTPEHSWHVKGVDGRVPHRQGLRPAPRAAARAAAAP